jgi:uncharacterized repeat protein (TIGR01451 family)
VGGSDQAVTEKWIYALPLPAGLDGVTRTVTISATDEVGNLSRTTRDLLVDTVAPLLNSSQLLTETVWLSGTLTVLAGSVSDGGTTIEQISVLVKSPDGAYSTRGVDVAAGVWTFNLFPSLGGSYSLWVKAEDAAGNRSVQGPYTVEVVVEPTLSKSSDTVDSAVPDGTINYWLAIRNTNAVTVENITITDPLPESIVPTGASGSGACLRSETNVIEWQPFSLGPNSVMYLGVSGLLTGTGVYSGAVISNTALITTSLWGVSASNTDYVTLRDFEMGPFDYTHHFPVLFKAHTAAGAGNTVSPSAQPESGIVPLNDTEKPYKIYLPLIFGEGQVSLPLCR